MVGQLDYKVTSNVTANTKYELGPKKYQVGATWDGKVANKVTQVKGWYTNKDNLVAGEATVSLNSKQKANVTFNQQKVSSGTGPALRCLCVTWLILIHRVLLPAFFALQLLTAKYTINKGTFTVEPSYNFPKVRAQGC